MQDVIDELREETRDQRAEISKLSREVDRLELRLADSGSHTSSQLDSLAIALDGASPSLPQTPAQWARCLRQIAKGGDWQNGTWR